MASITYLARSFYFFFPTTKVDMPLPLSIYNPQSQTTVTSANPEVGFNSSTYGGNVLGSGSTSTSGSAATGQLSTILIYGAIGLFAIWILQRIGE